MTQLLVTAVRGDVGKMMSRNKTRRAAENAAANFLFFFLLSSTCASVGSTSLHINSLIFDCGILIQLRSSSVGARSTGCRDTKADISVHVLSSRKDHFPENTLSFFFLLTEHKGEEQSNGQTRNAFFWPIIIKKKKANGREMPSFDDGLNTNVCSSFLAAERAEK